MVSIFTAITMELPFSPSDVKYSSTAENKQLNFSSYKVSLCEWQHKRINLWTPVDTINWVMSIAHVNGLDCEQIHKFRNVNGKRLTSMNEDGFVILEPNCGKALYRSMQTLKCEQKIVKLKGTYESSTKIQSVLLPESIKESDMLCNDSKSQELNDAILCSSTAVYKQLNLPAYQASSCKWQQKKIHQWTPVDTVNWVISVAHDSQLDCEEIHNFSDVDGNRLVGMSEDEFINFEPICGKALYRAMQIQSKQIKPKKKKKEKIGRLWEFVRDLLLNPKYCPSLVRWENHSEGIFRFVDSRKVARLWGTIKDNPKMTYEKFSRAMRYHYRRRVFEPVLGQRLVYKFGPEARGWQTSNPNFTFKKS